MSPQVPRPSNAQGAESGVSSGRLSKKSPRAAEVESSKRHTREPRSNCGLKMRLGWV